MKQLIPFRSLLLTTMALCLFCFSAFAGGEHFQVFLNKKLVLVKHVSEPISMVNLLDKTAASDEVVIHYSHCGQQGKDRKVTLKDTRGVIVKEWSFSDGKEGMAIPAREIAALQKKHGYLTLSYSSKELPKGRALASLNGNGKPLAAVDLKQVSPLKRMVS